MISNIIFVAGLLIAGFLTWRKFKNKTVGELKSWFVIGSILLASIVLAAFQPLAIQRIDAGNVGLKIARIGNDQGVPVAQPVKGWVVYNSWFNDVLEYSIRQQHVEYEPFLVTTKGGTGMQVKPSFNFELIPEKATDVYVHLLKGVDFAALKDNFIWTATAIAMRNATNEFAIDSIFNYQSVYQTSVEAELNQEMGDYFKVTQINPGQITPPGMSQILAKKAQQIQNAQEAELAKLTAIAEAETKIAIARGDSAQKVIAAKAEAEAMKFKQVNLTPQYIEFTKWSRWDGVLPGTMAGDGISLLFGRQ